MTDTLSYLSNLIKNVNQIDSNLFDLYNIKQGLRNKNKTGVLIGLTKIGCVLGYKHENNIKIPIEGKLLYRNYDISDLLKSFEGKDKYFERVGYLLIFGKLPDEKELNDFLDLIYLYSNEPIHFGLISNNIMNMLQHDLAKLYTFDKDPDTITESKIIEQSIKILGYFPDMILQAFLKDKFDVEKSQKLKAQKLGVAKYFLSMLNDGECNDDEVKIFDKLLLLHAEHGGGNNSTFSVRVVTSAYTDTYSAMVAGICSLKGARHGGANIMVCKMIDNIKANCNYTNKEELKTYLKRIINKEVFDKSGLIYGMGHAVYTLSDPRAMHLKENAKIFAEKFGMTEEFMLYSNIEIVTKEIFKETKKSNIEICCNVDLYSGFVNNSLGIDEDLYTPIFALSRIPSWTAHRAEQLFTDKKILRPGYKTI